MKKAIIGVLLFLCLFYGVYADGMSSIDNETPSPKNKYGSDHGFFLTIGYLYAHEGISNSNPEWTNNGLNLLFGLGYDFGRIYLNASFDIMTLSTVKCKYLTYYGNNFSIKGGIDFGAEGDIGFKLIDGKIFDLAIPVGVMYRLNTLKDNGDRDFQYSYLNIESSLKLSFRCSKSIFIDIPFNIGYPLYKSKGFDVLRFDLGVALRYTFT
jgi:hypothetical protein